jgi:hypothetical protein
MPPLFLAGVIFGMNHVIVDKSNYRCSSDVYFVCNCVFDVLTMFKTREDRLEKEASCVTDVWIYN